MTDSSSTRARARVKADSEEDTISRVALAVSMAETNSLAETSSSAVETSSLAWEVVSSSTLLTEAVARAVASADSAVSTFRRSLSILYTDTLRFAPVDSGAALGTAQEHLGGQSGGQSTYDSGLSGLFAQGLAMAQSYGVNKNPQDVDLDGDGIIDAHERAYGQQQGQGQGQKMDAQSMGAAAAMQAMKSFMGQGGGQAQQSSGGNMQSKVGGLSG